MKSDGLQGQSEMAWIPALGRDKSRKSFDLDTRRQPISQES